MSKKPLRVLVVDDNHDTADSQAILLRMRGCDVFVAYDGEEALKLACAWLPDVMLVDIAMPRVDGYQLAQQIRNQPGCKDTRLVAITGYSDEPHRRQGTAAGFDDYLVKPVDPDTIVRLLVELLNKEKVNRPVPGE